MQDAKVVYFFRLWNLLCTNLFYALEGLIAL